MTDQLHTTLLLQRLPGMGATTYWRLLDVFGSPGAVLEQSPESLGKLLKEPALEALNAHRQNPHNSDLSQSLNRDLEWLDQHPEIAVLTPDSADYPPLLREIRRPPPLLFVRGRLDALSLPQLAIVGSRSPTAGGLDNAHRFAAYLAENGFAITSGLALGVDGAAHAGALEAGGTTVAVMGTGIDRVYPARHRCLAEEIVGKGGALVSEFPLGTSAQAGNFPQRNRIISGLSVGTLVVEAAVQSGSLITARYALQQGREVFALPGSIHNPLARGCHGLIRDGATLVETAQDIAAELGGMLGYQKSLLPEVSPPSAAPAAGFSAGEQQVLRALAHDPVDMDSLARRSQLEVGRLAAHLISLELKGAVADTPNGYVRTLEIETKVS